MGKAALFIVAGFILLGTFGAINVQRGVAATEHGLSDHQYEVLTRNAALAGYQRARQLLAGDFDAVGTFGGDFEDITYEVDVTRGGDIAQIVSEGTVDTPSGRSLTYRIEAEIEREVTVSIADEVPDFMQYALISDDDLSLSGNVLAELYVQGDEANTLNANMHTNGSLYISGNSVTVRGFGTYVDYASASPAQALTGSFDPYYNPTDAPVVEQTPAIELPAFDAADFASKVSVDQSTSGDVELSGNMDLGGTRDDPYVWYVDGNLTTSGNTTVDGYVLFIVTGYVDFSGNLEVGESGYDGSEESSIALYVGGNVELSGNTRVHGQIFTGGDVVFMRGTPRIYGNIVTHGEADMRGTPKIYYRPASTALTTVFQEPIVHLNLISYSEW